MLSKAFAFSKEGGSLCLYIMRAATSSTYLLAVISFASTPMDDSVVCSPRMQTKIAKAELICAPIGDPSICLSKWLPSEEGVLESEKDNVESVVAVEFAACR